MRKQILSIVFLFLAVGMSGMIRWVALDGSQDYNTIQTAIDASAHGDTLFISNSTFADKTGGSYQEMREQGNS
ncbi:MAG: hypothetical protein FJ042_00530 [Candidatus Cloacimonetes bacterium]|nr:hypothetical protein [Candidatus Cloacimonadota bacterium]